RGAAWHLPQDQLTPESLATLLSELDRDQLRAMAEQARLLARPQAAARVADQLDRLVPAT
ncbi:MAG TPA: UDP-N-acetylglucosamine--N-acetylmuramyl-(pentapeptide) pyrophosphoryl-undecaprenol N-acetylglucosamine transferase, partial [Thermoanaerobaculia bacterium]